MSVQDPYRAAMPCGRTCGRWDCVQCGPKGDDKPALRRAARRILRQRDRRENAAEEAGP